MQVRDKNPLRFFRFLRSEYVIHLRLKTKNSPQNPLTDEVLYFGITATKLLYLRECVGTCANTLSVTLTRAASLSERCLKKETKSRYRLIVSAFNFYREYMGFITR